MFEACSLAEHLNLPMRTSHQDCVWVPLKLNASFQVVMQYLHWLFFLQLIKRSVFTGIVTTKVSVFKVHPRWKLLRFEVVSGEYLLYQSLFGGSEKHAWYCERCLCRHAYSLRFIILLFTEAVSYFWTVFKSNYFELINTKLIVFWRYSYKSGNFSSPRCKEDILT